MDLSEALAFASTMGIPDADVPRFLLAAGALADPRQTRIETRRLFGPTRDPLDYEVAPLRLWRDPRGVDLVTDRPDLADLAADVDLWSRSVRVSFVGPVGDDLVDYLRQSLPGIGILALSRARLGGPPVRPWGWPLRIGVRDDLRSALANAHRWSNDLVVPVDPMRRGTAPHLVVGDEAWIGRWAATGASPAALAVVLGSAPPAPFDPGGDGAGASSRAGGWVHLPDADGGDVVERASQIVFHLAHNWSIDESLTLASGGRCELFAPPGLLAGSRITGVISRVADTQARIRSSDAPPTAPSGPTEPTAPPSPPAAPSPPSAPSAPAQRPRPPRRTRSRRRRRWRRDPAAPTPDPPTTGAEPPTTGAEPPTTGAEPPTTGAEPPTTGAEPPATGAEPPAAAEEPPAAAAEPPTTPSLADDFRGRAFDSEIHDATLAARALGEARGETADREDRFLTADVTPRAGPRPAAQLTVWIAPIAAAGAAIAPEAFDDEALPWDGVALPLDIVLFELRDGGFSARRPIELPPTGESTRAEFSVEWDGGPFTARVAVLHDHRFVQSMLLTIDERGSEVHLDRECVVRPAGPDLIGAEPHQAALILNDHDGPLLAVATPAGEAIRAPQGLDDLRTSMTGLLTEVIDDPDAFGSLADAKYAHLLVELAKRGSTLRDVLFTGAATAVAPGIYDALRAAPRISVLSAVPTHVLPLELVYEPELRIPLGGSGAVCDTARVALEQDEPDLDALGAQCIHTGDGGTCGADESRVCPLGFWGFRKVIERHANRERSATVERDYAVSVSPDPQRATVDITHVLAAATPKADANPTAAWDAARAALAAALGANFVLAPDWPTIVAGFRDAATSHGLLLLLPHVDKDAAGQLLLDLGIAPHLPVHEIRPQLDLRRDKPLVLLLGCVTGPSDSPTEEFPGRFLDAGACAVLATMTMVRGRFVADIARGVVETLLRDIHAHQEARLGDAILRVRQMLLATNPLVLSLVAYGDADWSLTATTT